MLPLAATNYPRNTPKDPKVKFRYFRVFSWATLKFLNIK